MSISTAAHRPPEGHGALTDVGEARLAHSGTELDSSAFEATTGWKAKESIDDLVARFVDAEKAAA